MEKNFFEGLRTKLIPFQMKEGTLFGLDAVEEFNALDAETREKLKDRLSSYKSYQGGYEIRYDSESESFVAHFVKKCSATVYPKRNKPYIQLVFLSPVRGFSARTKVIKKLKMSYGANGCCVLEGSMADFMAVYDEGISFRTTDDNELRILQAEHIWFDNGGLAEYYSVGDKDFVNPTPAMRALFWATGKLELKSLNIDHHQNWWGLRLLEFSNALVEREGNAFVLDEDFITEEMIRFLAEDPSAGINAQRLWDTYKALSMSEDEKTDIIGKAQSVVEKYQTAINKNAGEIMSSAYPEVFSTSDTDDERQKFAQQLDGSCGFDCGFIYFTDNSKVVADAAKIRGVKENPIHMDGYFSLKLPVWVQSTTMKRRIANVMNAFFEKDGLAPLKFYTVLD